MSTKKLTIYVIHTADNGKSPIDASCHRRCGYLRPR